MSHAETTRRGLSGAVLAHLGEFRLEPREILVRRLGCLSAWGGAAFPQRTPASGRRPTSRQTGSERTSKAGSDQARMRFITQFERKLRTSRYALGINYQSKALLGSMLRRD